MNIQHSSRTDMWFTPLEILVMVQKVLGTIDLDPASCAEAREKFPVRSVVDRIREKIRSEKSQSKLTKGPTSEERKAHNARVMSNYRIK
jgi:hypothetical protein